jgi:ribosomal protein S27E
MRGKIGRRFERVLLSLYAVHGTRVLLRDAPMSVQAYEIHCRCGYEETVVGRADDPPFVVSCPKCGDVPIVMAVE